MQVHHISLIHKWFGEFEKVHCQAHGHDRSVEAGETMSVALFKCRNGMKGGCFRVIGHFSQILDITSNIRMRKSAFKALKVLSMETAQI